MINQNLIKLWSDIISNAERLQLIGGAANPTWINDLNESGASSVTVTLLLTRQDCCLDCSAR